MSTPLRDNKPLSAPRWARLHVRERSRVRAADRALERELASYRTPSEIGDLLAAVDPKDTPEGELVRRILARNLGEYRVRNPFPY